jgi:alkanesulfonate monooxygenase SsuD/methylene tetrahydromethanopterin reductase-like flavin-dependent oxidoreductase (luciferase family)
VTGIVLHAFNAEVAAAAERAGADSLWVRDDGGREAYTMLGALAACTSAALLGALVTDVTQRNPAIIAKQVTTIDLLSHGRAVLAIGGADEAHVEEALVICRAMFRDEHPAFEGRHYRIAGALNLPLPAQPGGPPILVDGHLALAARLADGAILRCGHEELRAELARFASWCGESDRDPGTMRTLWVRPDTAAPPTEGVPGPATFIVDPGPLEGAADVQEVLRAAR